MALTTYTYSVVSDITAQKVSVGTLTEDIQASSITIALDHINVTGDVLDIVFKNAISVAEETTLDSVVLAHAGNPLPQDLKRVEVEAQPPFANKIIGTKKIYNRVTGKTFSLSVGSNTCDFSIPYPHMKIVGVEVINGEIGDIVDFTVHDDASGTYSGYANLQLNQFGFDVNIAPDYYRRVCNYDADVYQNMVLKMTYNSQSAKTIYVNYLVHELKD